MRLLCFLANFFTSHKKEASSKCFVIIDVIICNNNYDRINHPLSDNTFFKFVINKIALKMLTEKHLVTVTWQFDENMLFYEA